MEQTKRNWFIPERSEALASLMLTARPDLSVRTESKQDDGVDFLVGLQDSANVPTTKHFVVQVKGTLSSDKNDWHEHVSQLYERGHALFLPACIFVVNVGCLRESFSSEPIIANMSAFWRDCIF